MRIIIVGGGKVGYYLAQTLLEHRHEPTVIEQNKDTCTRLANDLDIPAFCGDGTSLETLVSAGIERADAFVAVTGGDETNLIACELAKNVFHIQRTVAKANNPKNAEVMKKLGVDITVSSTAHIARLIEQEVNLSTIKQLVAVNHGESSINEVLLPPEFRFSGRPLMELKMPEQSIIVAIEHDGEVIIPRGNTRIYANDKLLIMAKNSVLHKVKELLHLDD